MAAKKKVSTVASRMKGARKGEVLARRMAAASKRSDAPVEEEDGACPGRLEHGTPTSMGLCPYCDAQLDVGEEEDVEDTTDINSLSKGDRIQVGGGTFKVTCVDRNVGEEGPLVELSRSASPKTLYTLMRHAKSPGLFLLSSSRSSREVDGWRKIERP